MIAAEGNQTDATNSTEHERRGTKKRCIETPFAAAIVTGICSLLAVFLGYWLSSLQARPESYEVVIQADAYPLPTTNIQLSAGDEVEIRVLGATTTYLNCGRGRTSPMGMIDNEYQKGAIYPGANFCSFIGRIGDGPYLAIGAFLVTSSEVNGKLKLGINDVTPDFCSNKTSPDACFKDNTGELAVKVTVHRKR